MLIFMVAVFLVAAGLITIPFVSLLCVAAAISSLILEAFLP